MADNAHIARVELLRKQHGCAAWVLRCLNCCPLTPPEIARVARGKWSLSTIRGALGRLRLAGFARKTRRCRRRARQWEAC